MAGVNDRFRTDIRHVSRTSPNDIRCILMDRNWQQSRRISHPVHTKETQRVCSWQSRRKDGAHDEGSLLFHLVSAMILMGHELDRPRSGRSPIGTLLDRARPQTSQTAGRAACLAVRPGRLPPVAGESYSRPMLPARCGLRNGGPRCHAEGPPLHRQAGPTRRPSGRPWTGRFEGSRQVKPELCISMDFPA